MARIRPAKDNPAPAPGAGGAGAPPKRRRPAGGTGPGNRQAPPVKQGSVTKAVQVGRASRFMSEVATELRKVTWPTRQQLFQATAVVIVFVAIVTAYLAALDEVFGRLVDAIF
ncbi:MAG: preprotein translocase subunit SecE [Actinomycetota bacterium]